MEQRDVMPGDLLLCRGASKKLSPSRLVRERIEAVTGSAYTHAAIALSASEIADARPGGVKIRPLRDLVAESVCVGVLRHPNMWDADRLATLHAFIRGLQAAKAQYNYTGVRNFQANKQSHEKGLSEALEEYFADQAAPPAPPSPSDQVQPYFCSELIVAALACIGWIGPGADVLYNPGALSPGDLLQDPTFGYLVGVLSPQKAFQLPSDDELRRLTAYNVFDPSVPAPF